MSRALWIASLARWAPALGYVAAIAIVGYLIHQRTLPPPPTAARDLGRNHRLAPGDLDTAAIRPLIGQYVKKEVKAGAPVTADLLSEKPLPAPIASTLAAVVAMPRDEVQRQAIVVSSTVRICVGGNVFGGASKVLALDCNEQACSAVVGLPKIPGQTVDPDLLANARLVIGAQSCAGP